MGGRCTCGHGVFLAEYDFTGLQEDRQAEHGLGVWKFGAVLPPPVLPVSRSEGNTPLLHSQEVGKKLSIDLFFKDEGRNPSGSFKDRGTAVMLGCLPSDVKTVVLFSSGNAASSVALYAALRRLRAIILMYRGSREKSFMARAFGALCLEVDASEGELLGMAEEAAHKFGWHLVTTTGSANPTVLEGYKTIAYELVDEIKGSVDVVVVPVASGSLLAGIWKGFLELKRLGRLQDVPKLIGVQSEAIAPIYRAFVGQKGRVMPQENPGETIAKGLALDNPGADGDLALHAVRSSGGCVVQVSDEEMLSAARRLALQEGILTEPSGAASVAGLVKARAQGAIGHGEKAVCVLTGSGLKDIAPVDKLLPVFPRIKPDLDQLSSVVASLQKEKRRRV